MGKRPGLYRIHLGPGVFLLTSRPNKAKRDMATNLTTEILKQIRDGIRDLRQGFNERLDQTNARLDQTSARLDLINTRLARVEHGLEDLGKLMRRSPSIKPSTSAFMPSMSSDWKGMYPT